MPLQVPRYDELPVEKDAPAGSAWGVFDHNSKRDTLGTLNFVTRDAVVAAREEIQTGESVVLNLPLHLPHNGASGRIKFKHKFMPNCFHMACCDEELTLNTQSSSQWDGLLHYANQARREYYNGVKYADAAEARTDLSLGIHVMSERGGIVGRGVLLDFVRYAARKGIKYFATDYYAISLAQIEEMIHDAHLILRQGDILIIRTGLSKWIRNSTPENASDWGPGLIGVDPTPELLAWIWNQNLGAVASDAIAFEAIDLANMKGLPFHEAALPGWGMPIGELFDLEELSIVAEKNQRWSFFITVCPLNIKGGAATISNTLAVF